MELGHNSVKTVIMYYVLSKISIKHHQIRNLICILGLSMYLCYKKNKNLGKEIAHLKIIFQQFQENHKICS